MKSVMFKLIFHSVLLFLLAMHTNSSTTFQQHINPKTGTIFLKEILNEGSTKTSIISPEREEIVKYGVVSFIRDATHWCKKSIHHSYFYQDSHKFLHTVKSRMQLGCKKTSFYTNFFDVDLGYRQLATGELDIVTEPLYVGLAQMHNVRLLYPHEMDDLCFLVGALPPQKVSMLLTVSLSIWMATAACVLSVVVAAGLGLRSSWADAAFAGIGCLITGASFGCLHRLCLWVSLLSFFLWNFIGGSLTGSIVSPGRGREFRTVEEVDAAFQRFYAPPTMEVEFLEWMKLQSNTYSSVISKFTDFNTNKTGDFDPNEEAILTYKSLVPFYKIGYYENFPLIQTSVCIFSPCYKSFSVRKNWHHAKSFEKIIQRSEEAGLLKKYKDDTCTQLMLCVDSKLAYCSPTEMQSSDDTAKPVQLENLKEGFVIWGTGIFLSFICFLLENRSRILLFQRIRGIRGVYRVCHIF